MVNFIFCAVIPPKVHSIESSPTVAFFFEIDLRKKKWLLSCSYNLHRENIENHLETLSKSLALHSFSYENLITVGKFNLCVEEFCMSGICDPFCLKSLLSKMQPATKTQKAQVALTPY